MPGQSAGAMIPEWGVWFAREPEPEFEKDFEKDFEESDEPVVLGSSEPSTKPPHLRPWLLVLLLLMVAGGTYLASDPSLVLELIGQGPPSPSSAPTPTEPPMLAPPATDSTALSTPTPEQPLPTLPVTPLPGPMSVSIPLFAEGQRVTVQPDSSSQTGSVALSGDADGTRPGPTVRVGSTLTVLDAELQKNAWIYSVRAETGAKGWIAEMRLAAK